MEFNESAVQEFMRRLLFSRMRILNDHPFFGLLLMHIRYAIDEEAPTAYTDGERIAFGPDFLRSLSDSELDFVMMHEIMHVVLKHCWRGEDIDNQELFNIACDIVVNSNILLENNFEVESIALRGHGPSMHLTPDGREGHEFTAEEVYEMFPKSTTGSSVGFSDDHSHQGDMSGEDSYEMFPKSITGSSVGFSDDHSHWGDMLDEDSRLAQITWTNRLLDVEKAIRIRESTLGQGLMPAFAERYLLELRRAQTDWRTLLSEFLQQDSNDYSFTPPDRRMLESPFFLPDFNSEEGGVRDVLFMIDTSGSISDEMMAVAFSEVQGALEQFEDSFEGWLGFFDAAVTEPVRFSDVDELGRIKPIGGGGTDFQVVFDYVSKCMEDEPPACIIMLTDGCAPFPPEDAARGIPVLWLLNNEHVTPPWGRVARFNI